MSERWVPVIGYEGIYEVSDFGRIKRIKRGPNTFVGRILRPWLNARGYQQITLYKNGKGRAPRIHQIVMTSFIGPRPSRKQVNHVDGDRTNNRLDNLEYVTQSENMLHAYRIGLERPTYGEAHWMGKLTEDDIHEIRKLVGKESYQSIGARFNVSGSMIGHIAAGKRWGWLKEENDET